MKYFIANLVAHSLVVLFLVLLMVLFTNRNHRKKTRHSLAFFLPLLLSGAIIYDMVFLTAPRFLDLSAVINQNYYSYTGTVEKIGYFNNYIVIDGKTYYINPLRDLPSEGTYVRVRYSGHSLYAIEVAPIEPTDVTDSVNEDVQTTAPETEADGN